MGDNNDGLTRSAERRSPAKTRRAVQRFRTNTAPPKSIADELVEYVRQNDWVTFVEAAKFLEAKGVPTKGNETLSLGSENMVLWAGVSREFSTLIASLINKRVYIHPTSALSYLMSGEALKLPLAKNVGPYKRPRWLPVALRPVPVQL